MADSPVGTLTLVAVGGTLRGLYLDRQLLHFERQTSENLSASAGV